MLAASEQDEKPFSALTPYEQERLETIRRNNEKLKELGLVRVVPRREPTASLPSHSTPADARPLKRRRAPPKRTDPIPTRKSRRINKDAVESDHADVGSASGGGDGEAEDNEHALEAVDMNTLVCFDDYFGPEVAAKAVRVDGQYRGWLAPQLMERYGFEASAAEAWEANGGGTFSFKNPLGEMKSAAGLKKPAGWSNAKWTSYLLLRKNPNAHFYRHTEEAVQQHNGDWTDEERDLFLAVAREKGCGDKWGLFASHIPHRVGYQCSNYYRSYILPQGLVFDSNYMLTKNGAAVYVGSRKPKR
ncbi:hypothetical protein HK104_011496 [Borealophlyctis nickersoniae]|nr:hypothetical protein HK104_011496 [Borealophlyctis nickersoniae]